MGAQAFEAQKGPLSDFQMINHCFLFKVRVVCDPSLGLIVRALSVSVVV